MVKPHGLRGETVVYLITNRAERAEPGAVFSTDVGELLVEQARPFQGRWLVVFQGVHTREASDALRGVVLRAPALEDPGALWVHELVGADVVRAGDGAKLGRVAAVVANPASDLLELEGGGLVPLRFVIDHGPGRVVVDVPAGLLE
ncbi:MAG: ribosome maturation factor RimM [Acidimicrobiales bacterium]